MDIGGPIIAAATGQTEGECTDASNLDEQWHTGFFRQCGTFGHRARVTLAQPQNDRQWGEREFFDRSQVGA